MTLSFGLGLAPLGKRLISVNVTFCTIELKVVRSNSSQCKDPFKNGLLADVFEIFSVFFVVNQFIHNFSLLHLIHYLIA